MGLCMHNCYKTCPYKYHIFVCKFVIRCPPYITLRVSCTNYVYLYVLTEPAQGQSTLSAIVPARGSAKGGDEFVLLGHKFTSPCK